MSGNKVAIYGASQGGLTLKECIDIRGEYEVGCFLDDDPAKIGTNINTIPIYAGKKVDKLKEMGIDYIVCAIADYKFRLKMLNKAKILGLNFINAVHSYSWIAPSVKMGIGNFIKAGAIIETHSAIGNCCVIDNGVVIAHNNIIEDGVHLAPGVSLGSNISVGEGSIIGIGASISTGIKIGKDAIVVVGAAVINDVPSNCVVEGVPAKIIGKKK